MKRALTKNIGLKIISLLVAILFWLVVVNIDDPEVTATISGIPVTVLDEDAITSQNQVYYIKSGDTASIIVKGPRSIIDKLGKDDFVAEAPLSEKSNVDAVPIYVRLRSSKYEKEVDISQKTMTMKLDVESIVTKNYDIEIDKIGSETAGYAAGKITLIPATVTVTAPESVINLISRVAVDVDLSGHTEDFKEDVSIKYYTELGKTIALGDKTSVSSTATTVTGSINAIKEVPIRFGTVGTVEEDYELVELVADKQTVKITGSKVDTIDSIVFPNELINISGATSNVETYLDVGAQIPSGITIVDETKDMTVKVTAIIEPLITKTYKLTSSEIEIKNLPEGYIGRIKDKRISFALKGLQRNLDSFSLENADAYIDLKNAVEGFNEIAVKMTIPDDLLLTDTVTVPVVLNKKDVETTKQETSHETTGMNGTETIQNTTGATIETTGEIETKPEAPVEEGEENETTQPQNVEG